MEQDRPEAVREQAEVSVAAAAAAAAAAEVAAIVPAQGQAAIAFVLTPAAAQRCRINSAGPVIIWFAPNAAQRWPGDKRFAMIISVASGKGGTGKTTIATSLALSIGANVQFIDCDVEEPNAHIFLKPEIKRVEKAFIPVPEIEQEKCNYCQRCQQVCAYNAIAVIPASSDRKGSILTFPYLCHGCGACAYLCPQKAIKEVGKEIGAAELGNAGPMQFIHGRLNIGEAMAPPLIRQIKSYINPTRTVIIDAPPGTSCPVVESVKESDFCILVTEPTPFGLNDLTLAVEVLRKLKIPFGIVVNRFDLGDSKTDDYCQNENIPIMMRIPFREKIAKAYSKGQPIVEVLPQYKKDFRDLFKTIKDEKFS
jgi:MinD superfamily P-loop ATPase